MAQIPYRANLNTKSFPFDSGNFGRTVIVPGNDQYADETNPGIPQVYYVQNAVPTEFGYKSVNLASGTAGPAPGAGNNIYFFGATEIFGQKQLTSNPSYPNQEIGSVIVYAVNRYNVTPMLELWYKNPQTSAWVTVTTISNFVDTRVRGISSARVNARNFIAVPHLNVTGPYLAGGLKEVTWTYSPTTITFTNIQPTGIPNGTFINGILANRGRMLIWSEDTVYWSSLTNPVDFTPSLITGAGNTKIQEARGEILCCVATLYGFIVYCANNIVAAEYTGNLAAPWSFREIYNSAGVRSWEHISKDHSVDTQFAYTEAGVTRISDNIAQVTLAELIELLRRKRFQVYNSTTKRFSAHAFGANELDVAVAAVGKRYVAISIPSVYWNKTTVEDNTNKTNKYSYCFLYDSVLKKWGMVKVDHNFVFTWPQDNSVAFLQHTGDVLLMYGSDRYLETIEGQEAYVILGKYQLSRTHKVRLQKIQIENREDSDFQTTCTVLSTLDGKNIAADATPANVTPSPATNSLLTFNCNIVGENHSIVIGNKFDVNTVILTGAKDGKL
jgi:hypothetical protein